MKRTLSIILCLILCIGLFAGCKATTPDGVSSATQKDETQQTK